MTGTATPAHAPEIIEVKDSAASCDGGGALGHPKVYLRMKPGNTSIVCPYCSRMFVLRGK